MDLIYCDTSQTSCMTSQPLTIETVAVNNRKMADLIALLPEQWSTKMKPMPLSVASRSYWPRLSRQRQRTMESFILWEKNRRWDRSFNNCERVVESNELPINKSPTSLSFPVLNRNIDLIKFIRPLVKAYNVERSAEIR